MLDFDALRTPPHHGDVLVAPPAGVWADALRENQQLFADAPTRLLGRPLRHWRRQTRLALLADDSGPVIVTGHQPGFIHPGVWAKHVVASRFARAVAGTAFNLVVDSDTVKEKSLLVSVERRGRIQLHSIPVLTGDVGGPYEQLAPKTMEHLKELGRAVRDAMGTRYEASSMPAFLDALAAAGNARDWAEQMIAARRAVEAQFDVRVSERRVSTIGCAAVLVDMLLNADRFAASYNSALARYRAEQRVRGAARPIPDLICDAARCEVPFWAYRVAGPRRRLFVGRDARALRLWADDIELPPLPRDDQALMDTLGGEPRMGEWRLRPRALALTLWARLMLADLFVHGIGGAKYDRVTDTILERYYGLRAPHMACVSATLWLFPDRPASAMEDFRRLQRTLRDLVYNPQRSLFDDPRAADLIRRRAAHVELAERLRGQSRGDRAARRDAFDAIRRMNQQLGKLASQQLRAAQEAFNAAQQNVREDRAAHGREYFFALYSREALDLLLKALPAATHFGV